MTTLDFPDSADNSIGSMVAYIPTPVAAVPLRKSLLLILAIFTSQNRKFEIRAARASVPTNRENPKHETNGRFEMGNAPNS